MRILVAVDLKSDPEALVDAAKEWGERLSSPIDLVYVDETAVPLPKVHNPEVQSVLSASWYRQRAEYEGALQVLLERMPSAIRGRVILESGPVVAAVLRASADHGLVILGNDSHSGFAAILGSASESLARAFRKPVLLLRVAPE